MCTLSGVWKCGQLTMKRAELFPGYNVREMNRGGTGEKNIFVIKNHELLNGNDHKSEGSTENDPSNSSAAINADSGSR